jgi:hypothetical protein
MILIKKALEMMDRLLEDSDRAELSGHLQMKTDRK